MGCIIDKTHVLTAAHCWTAVKHEYEWPAVFTLDRWYRCDVAFYNEEADILLLRLIELVRQFPTSLKRPERYGQLGDGQISLGAQVGFISQLTLPNTLNHPDTMTHFSAAFVSMMVPGTEPPRFALSGTVVQGGFSGSPVFFPSGSIVGVLVASLSFRANFQDAMAPIYILPVISPIKPVLRGLRDALETK